MTADPDRAALRWLEIAEECGEGIVLGTRMEDLAGIEPWLQRRSGLDGLETPHAELLHTALYEACANIAEHGYGHAEGSFQMWWIPERTPSEDSEVLGRFVLCDHGRSFSAETWKESDFHDPVVRKRTRGFGLDIIHRVMCSFVYRPMTSKGNITVLAFDPLARELKEARHA